MLIKKLPVIISPPRMSIFWSTSWPYEIKLRVKYKVANNYFCDEEDEKFHPHGFEPDCKNARRILYKGENIRVWPHEFTAVSPEHMKMYVMEDCSHELVTVEFLDHVEYEGSRSKALILDKVTTPIYEAALIDGCTESQAKLIAMGMDITAEEPEFPPIGWYRIKKEFGLVFCTEEELEETELQTIKK